MNPATAKRLRLFGGSVGILVAVVAVAAGWFYSRMRASLPMLDGTVAFAALTAPITIERDDLGVPTIRGANRDDVARALGWVHAQDRFFQMDLLRRRGAGELAELFGKNALPLDRASRRHGFRMLAGKVLAQLAPAERTELEAYAAGVNAGLAALKARPFEYLVLRETPRPWQPVDTLLVQYAMTLDLQDGRAVYERSLATLRDQFGADALGFFAPLTTPDDAAIDGSIGQRAPVPPVGVLAPQRAAAESARPQKPVHPGSNAFALAGAHTANGAALLANDMHLDHAVPNTWYRASLEWPGHKVSGVTLPGGPLVVAGSNGRVAWGFANANIDTSDVVVIEADSGTTRLYPAPGFAVRQQIEVREEIIRVKGSDSVTFPVSWTLWGPIIGTNAQNRPLALRWTAHDPATVNLTLRELEEATTVTEAVNIAHRAGIPAQNFLAADSAGNIAWTIAGYVPKRVGFDGRLPVSWAFGDRRWDGYLAPAEVPVQLAPASGRLWSANQRMVGGTALAQLGDGAYAPPARAAQIRDRLAPLERATPKDLLAIQLDDRALFLERWQKLLLATLTPEAIAQKKTRGELRAAVEKWEARASVDSISYRLVSAFRDAVSRRVIGPLYDQCMDVNPEFNGWMFNLEEPLWSLLQEKPGHLVHPAWILAAADDVMEELAEEHLPLARATWGRKNRLRAVHPFSHALPALLTNWLNLPADPLPGGLDMPRVQTPRHGASERFVVSPGHEAEGIFQMPGGQSGHPLSPYYLAGHDAWVRGEPAPFLPRQGRTFADAPALRMRNVGHWNAKVIGV